MRLFTALLVLIVCAMLIALGGQDAMQQRIDAQQWQPMQRPIPSGPSMPMPLGHPLALDLRSPFLPTIIPPQPDKHDWSGYYAIDGQDSDKEYSGVALVEKIKSIYVCTFTLGPKSVVGIGQLKNGVLAVAWTQGDPVRLRGVTVYTRRDNDLVGTWTTLPGTGEPQREVLSWLRKAPTTAEPPGGLCCCEPPCRCDKCNCGKAGSIRD